MFSVCFDCGLDADGMILYIEMETKGSTQRLTLVLESDGSETIEGVKEMIHSKLGTNVSRAAPALPKLCKAVQFCALGMVVL